VDKLDELLSEIKEEKDDMKKKDKMAICLKIREFKKELRAENLETTKTEGRRRYAVKMRRCDTCDREYTTVSYYQHLKSNKHAKNMKKMK